MVGAIRKKNFFWLITLAIIVAIFIISIPWFWRLFYPFPYRESVLRHSREFKLDPNLVISVIRVESKFRPIAESPRGARGLMQLMPDTAEWSAEKMKMPYKAGDLFDPDYNITLGCWYLSNLLHEFDDSIPKALAAYNGGRGNVQNWLREEVWDGNIEDLDSIPFRETREFVSRVLHDYKIYNMLYK